MRWAFTTYDVDNNGYVTRDEMLEILQAIHQMVGKENNNAENGGEKGGEKGGENGGTNGDESGGIHLSDDPQDIVDKLFVQMDRNKDGKLSMEEFVTSAKTDPTIAKLLQCEEAVRMHGGTPSLTKQE